MKKAEATRLEILKKAYDLIYSRGYQTTSLDDILATTEVTKGAFYYHFKNKEEMGIAIISEILKPKLLNHITKIFAKEADSLEMIYKMIKSLLIDNDFLKLGLGCPLSNLIQEMAVSQNTFAKALNDVTDLWLNKITDIVEIGKNKGEINSDVNSQFTAQFIISGYWGIRNFGRMHKGKQIYNGYLTELKNYLKSLA